MNEAVAPRRRSLFPLWAMLAVFALPVVSAWFLYLNPEYLPTTRSNRGDLIEAIVTLPTGEDLLSVEGTPFDSDKLSGRWTLVVLGQASCSEPCLEKLREIRQIRLALGESRLSVERLLLATDSGFVVESELAGTQVATLTPAGAQHLLDQLGDDASAYDRIYILDPMGRLMMRYRADAPAKDILKDMERLLKASKNWIKGAQYGHQ